MNLSKGFEVSPFSLDGLNIQLAITNDINIEINMSVVSVLLADNTLKLSPTCGALNLTELCGTGDRKKVGSFIRALEKKDWEVKADTSKKVPLPSFFSVASKAMLVTLLITMDAVAAFCVYDNIPFHEHLDFLLYAIAGVVSATGALFALPSVFRRMETKRIALHNIAKASPGVIKPPAKKDDVLSAPQDEKAGNNAAN